MGSTVGNQSTSKMQRVHDELHSVERLVDSMEKALDEQPQRDVEKKANKLCSHNMTFMLSSALAIQQWLEHCSDYKPQNNGVYPIIDADGKAIDIKDFIVKPNQGPYSIDKAIPFVSPHFSPEERASLYNKQLTMKSSERFAYMFKSVRRQSKAVLDRCDLNNEKLTRLMNNLHKTAFVSSASAISKASCLGVIQVLIHQNNKRRQFSTPQKTLESFTFSKAPETIIAFTCPHDFNQRESFNLPYSEEDRYRMNADLRHFDVILKNNHKATLITAFSNRDIKAGEEICLNYSNINPSGDFRRATNA